MDNNTKQLLALVETLLATQDKINNQLRNTLEKNQWLLENLANNNRKIMAIRIYKKVYGVSLLEARDKIQTLCE